MDFAKLIPLVRTYASELSDQEVADAINAKTIPCRKLVSLDQVKLALIGLMVWPQLLVSDSALAKTAVNYIDDPKPDRFNNLDMDRADTKALVAGMKMGGFITDEQVAMLDAMANSTTSLSELHGLGEVSSGEVATARAWRTA